MLSFLENLPAAMAATGLLLSLYLSTKTEK